MELPCKECLKFPICRSKMCAVSLDSNFIPYLCGCKDLWKFYADRDYELSKIIDYFKTGEGCIK